MTRYTHRVGRAPIRATLSNGRITAHVERPSNRSRHASGAAWVLLLGVLVALAAAVVVVASRPAHGLSCHPDAHPCDAVGDPPPMQTAPPFGACAYSAGMCPQVALPVVTR